MAKLVDEVINHAINLKQGGIRHGNPNRSAEERALEYLFELALGDDFITLNNLRIPGCLGDWERAIPLDMDITVRNLKNNDTFFIETGAWGMRHWFDASIRTDVTRIEWAKRTGSKLFSLITHTDTKDGAQKYNSVEHHSHPDQVAYDFSTDMIVPYRGADYHFTCSNYTTKVGTLLDLSKFVATVLYKLGYNEKAEEFQRTVDYTTFINIVTRVDRSIYYSSPSFNNRKELSYSAENNLLRLNSTFTCLDCPIIPFFPRLEDAA